MNPLIIELGKAAIPLIPKLLKAKKDDGDTIKNFAKKTAKSSGLTGAAQIGVFGALKLVYDDMMTCGGISTAALSCVTDQTWMALGGAIIFFALNVRRKLLDSEVKPA